MSTFRNLLLAGLFALITAPSSAQTTDAVNRLQRREPWLYRLYAQYPQYRDRLATYAVQQGFVEPENLLATSVHELIHIDSAAHQGFSVGGAYLAPYVARSAWPFLTNADVAAYLAPAERARLGLVFSVYVKLNPSNRLGNVLDEINAYTQTTPFLCAEAPRQAVVPLENLIGHIMLVEFYLRTLAERFPDQYRKLAADRVSRGALETLVASAYTTLNTCHQLGVAAADPRPVPKNATRTFAEQPK